MNEQYVSFETAKLLKEKGFDWDTDKVYERNLMACRYEDYPMPTQQIAIRWLVKNHNIHIEPHFLRESGDYVYNIIHSPLALDDIHSFPVVFNTIEDAIEEALEYALKNLI